MHRMKTGAFSVFAACHWIVYVKYGLGIARREMDLTCQG